MAGSWKFILVGGVACANPNTQIQFEINCTGNIRVNAKG